MSINFLEYPVSVIFNTTNGGANWNIQITGEDYYFTSVHFINANTGWAVGDYGRIRNTTNSGIDWGMAIPTYNGLNSVYFTDKNVGWAVGNNGTVIHTAYNNVYILNLTSVFEGFYDPITNSMISDSITVYLKSSENPFPVVDSAKAYLNSFGQASFDFNNISNNTGLYIEIKHRNGLETWSKTPLSFTSNQLSYDFTDNPAKAYGNNLKHAGDKWVIYTGDVNQDGIIDLTDIAHIFNNAAAFVSGYVSTDVNGDNITDLTDVLLAYNNSTGIVEKITPLNQP